MKFGLEAKVGIFVITVFLMLGYMTTKVSDFSFYKSSGYVVTYQLPSASGVTKDASVKFRGVTVGKVEDISLNNGNVNVKLRIESKYKIPDNVQLTVRSSGFLGEKYVELQTTKETSKGYLADGEVLKDYKSGTDIDELTSQLGEIAGDVKAITSALKEVLASTEGKNNMKATLKNVRVTTEMMREMIKNNQERTNNIVANVENLTSTLKNITVSNQQNINELIANLKSFSEELNRQTPVIAEKINRIAGNLDEIVGGSKNDLKDTISNMRTVTAKLEKTVDNVNEITDKINKGEGTVGTLINDNETAKNVKETIKGLKKMVNQYEKFQLDLEFAGEQMLDTGESKGYFKAKISPSDEKYYLLGLASSEQGTTTTTVSSHTYDNPPDHIGHDYTEREVEREEDSITFIAQYAHEMFYDDLFLRLGIMESEFGVGLDYSILEDDSLIAYFDAYDFSDDENDRDPHLKAKLRYKFGDYFFVDGGYDDMMNSDTGSFFVGGGLSFTDNDLKYLLGKVPFPAQ
ncbi:MAG: MCE family protein [Flexistipes sinusarabici]|uniref:MCE family protein n=1 Tax=Flexistipes sinusarabici TaxID=2352 RepID=A0A5D0MJA7_FLESI|nr:MlaD family protein [Flexistipes sinusarabici]TYB33066.1 MAG: MCE family protein [Flexistipes sinusarabici]